MQIFFKFIINFNKTYFMKKINFLIFLLPLILFSNLAKSNYNDSLIHYNKALYLYNHDKYNEAIREFTNSIEFENQFNYKSYYYRGRAYLELNNYEKSILDFTNSIKFTSSDNGYESNFKMYSFIYRGLANESLENFDAAINDYSDALKLEPYVYQALKYRAEVYFKVLNYKSALEDLNKAIEHYTFPNTQTDLYCLRGLIYEEYGWSNNEDIELYLLSLKDFNKSIELNKKNVEAYFGRGKVKVRLKDYRGGILEFNKVILMSPGFTGAFYMRGLSKLYLKRYNDAISDFNITLKKRPNYILAYYFRGKSKQGLKNISGACLDWSKAGELGLKMAYDEINKFCK